MKFLLYTVFLLGALLAGVVPRPQAPRPLITRLLTFALLGLTMVLTFLPPIVGTFGDAIMARERSLAKQDINVIIGHHASAVTGSDDAEYRDPSANRIVRLRFASAQTRSDLMSADPSKNILITVRNEGDHGSFLVTKVIGSQPLLILPYIPALEERSRILFLHVPMSWVGFLAFIVTLWYSVLYLRMGSIEHDRIAAASAGIGVLFCSLAYVTGALWAKFNWGKFFNWDTREFSVLILLLLYGAYFALRSSIPQVDRRARVSGVYAIVSCIAALFLLFIVPRVTESLHPGSQSDVNAGPIISTQADAINLTKAWIFSLSLAAFTLLYFMMLNLRLRLESVEVALAAKRSRV